MNPNTLVTAIVVLLVIGAVFAIAKERKRRKAKRKEQEAGRGNGGTRVDHPSTHEK